jgi:DNA-binding NtrC family response regulator
MRSVPTILVVDDEATIADGLRLTLESEGYAVCTAASVREALAAFAQCAPQAAIVDLMLPDGDGLTLTRELRGRDAGLQVIVITAYGSVRKAMEATKGAGAFHVLEKPFDPDELLALVRNALDHRRLLTENADLKRRLAEQVADGEILGQAPGIQRVMETVAAIADADANVLIVGESGTGKELVANALHEQSRRRRGPWVKINCAALPKDLIESELFGHTKGAFTGATTEKTGLLEAADGGSLLLDEITEMPADLQAKLLRVLEERVVRPLGAAKSIPVDFRLISSTNRSPEVALREGRLRQDLFFRINTVSIQVPPLRDRREDLPLLVRTFLERYRAKHGRPVEGIEPEAYRRLLAYSWPGNVRELQHAVERAVLVAHGPLIALGDLPEPLRRSGGDRAAGTLVTPSEVPAGSLEEIERASIIKALETTKWNKQAAAALLGLRRPTLYSKMRRHGIPQRRA